MRKHLQLSILSALFLAISCSEPIRIDTGSGPETVLAVDGVVTDLECHQYVRLSLTEDFNTPLGKIPVVSGASVSVACEGETFEYEEDAENPGTYLSVLPFKGETGKTYELRIEAVVCGERSVYRAVDSVPAPGMQLDSIDYIYSKDIDHLWTLAVWGHDIFETSSRYLIQTGVNGHFKPLDQSLELPDEHYDGMTFSNLTFAALHHTEEMWKAYGECYKPLERGDEINVRVSTLSEGYGIFLMNYNHLIFGTIPILTDQPSNLGTNITGSAPAVGYFGACAVTQISCTVDDPWRTEFR